MSLGCDELSAGFAEESKNQASKLLEKRQVAIFEAKYAKTVGGLEVSYEAALQQIEDRQYAKDFVDDYDDILCYGIAFYQRQCLVQMMWGGAL